MTSKTSSTAKKRKGTPWILFFLLAMMSSPCVLAIVIRVALVEAFECDGPSMEPTLFHGDRFVVDKTAFGLFLPFTSDAVVSWGAPEPGDVVIVRSPADEIDIVKRVIGIAGDRIEIRDGVVHRNGESIVLRELEPDGEYRETEESLGDHVWHTRRDVFDLPETNDEVTVPAGHVFVLGDHRDHSNDSRNPQLGFIPIDRLKGRATVIYWSRTPGRVGRGVD
jgi:signal peptidase I